MKKSPGPVPDRGKYKVIGKYLHDAMLLAGKTQAEFARLVSTSPGNIAKIMAGTRSVDRQTLLDWCKRLETPEWLSERLLNAAGYATSQQEEVASSSHIVEETHQTVLEQISHREN